MGKQQMAATTLNKDDLIVICGAGGFIAGALTRYFHDQGFVRLRAVDKKPLPEWYQRVPGVENLCLDLSDEDNCKRAVEGAAEVYNLAADMGGMGFIERFRIDCLRSILINTHLIEAAYWAGVERYFFSSSACAYNTELQEDPNVRALKESDAYPAMAERGIRLGEVGFGDVLRGILVRTRHEDRDCAVSQCVWSLWDVGWGREKAPAALCRKAIEAKDNGNLED